ncbi:MAG: (d)CMP kinase [Planctomycetota bacterium]
MIVTIDGPAGSGKSTAARKLSERLGFRYLETGAIYRALTLCALRAKADLENGPVLAELFRRNSVEPVWAQEGIRVFLNGEDVSAEIRTRKITERVKSVARHAEVRRQVNELTRGLAKGRSAISEGRDQGTVVFPDADVKFYLDAKLDVRARRRYEELVAAGERATLEEVRRELEQRDESDLFRKVAPLRQAPDAVRVDSSELTVEEMVGELERVVMERKSNGSSRSGGITAGGSTGLTAGGGT